MKKGLVILYVILSSFVSKSQIHLNSDTIQIYDYTKNQVRLLASDSLCSTFFISIPNEVKLHYHAFHSENVMVTDGRGVMKLGDKEFEINKGDVIVIPKGTRHSVRNTGKVPLKVISIQSPYFDGSDRILVD